jgi:phage repressor protein C with HTH and peptisase S24 domain
MDSPGDRLRFARKKAKLSVEVLAKRVGFSSSGVRAHENGQNNIKPDVAEAYGKVLRIAPSWLLYGEGEAPDDHLHELVAAPLEEEMSAIEVVGPRDYVQLEVLPTYAGLGGGGSGEGDIEFALLPRSLVESELRAAPRDLLVINVRGDSMLDPKTGKGFAHGDQLIIDRRDVNPRQPGAFALWYDDGYVVKNVERVPRSSRLRIFSNNPTYSPDEAEEAEVKIMGRPVWFARRL